MAKIVKRRKLNALESLYVWEVMKGMAITFRHFLIGLFRTESLPTLSYPEFQPELPQDYRGKHRLMKRSDGEPRCVACYMCSTACPAQCIYITAEESKDPRIEKKAKTFEIDHLLCVFCGLCVEACPVDAIRMDTKVISVVGDNRKKFRVSMTELLDWNPADYPADDDQSHKAPGGRINTEARAQWAPVGGKH